MKHRLRPATDKDGDWIYRLKVMTLKAYVAQTWGWDEAYQRERFRQRFDPSSYQIVVVDGQEVGVIQVEWRETEVFLGNIQIAPECQGRGLGSSLIRDVLAEAESVRLPIVLQVLKVNPARRLYERLGFVITEETATHYKMRVKV